MRNAIQALQELAATTTTAAACAYPYPPARSNPNLPAQQTHHSQIPRCSSHPPEIFSSFTCQQSLHAHQQTQTDSSDHNFIR